MKYIKEFVKAEADKAHKEASEKLHTGTHEEYKTAEAAAWALEKLYRKLISLPSSAWRD